MPEAVVGESTLSPQDKALQKVEHLFDNVRIFSQIRGFVVEDAGSKMSGKAAGMRFTLIDAKTPDKIRTKKVSVKYDALRTAIDGIESEEFEASTDGLKHTQKLRNQKGSRIFDSKTGNEFDLRASVDRLDEVVEDIVKSP